MAGELATGFISLVPSFRGAEPTMRRELSAAAGSAGSSAGSEAGRRFNTSFGSVLKTGAKGLGIISAIAVGAGAALGGFGVKSAASLEQTTVAFTSLLGSAQKAHAEISDLQKFAAKTPFSQQDVFGYAQQYFALADSVGLAKDQVKPFLSAVGDIAAVTGASTENIHNAVLAIGQIGSAGKVTQDNLRQISEAFPGFNANAAIASATGQTTAEVMKQISAGTLDASTGVQALIAGMQKFPGAAGAMEKQSKTLNGLFSTFKDTISISLTKSFTPLIPTIKKLLADLVPVVRSALKTFAPAITSFFKNILPLIKPLIGGLSDAFAAIFDALGPALKALAPVIKPLADSFVLLVQAISPIVQLLAEGLATALPPLLTAFNAILAAVQPVIAVLVDALRPVLPVIADAFKRLFVALRPVIDALAGSFVTVIKAIAPELPDLARAVGDLAVACVELIKPLIPIIDVFSKLEAKVLPPLVKALTHVADVVTWLFNHVIRPVFKGILDLFLTVVGGIVKGAASMFGWVPFVGDKLNSAADAIDEFRRRVDDEFTAINRAAVVTPRVIIDPALAALNKLNATVLVTAGNLGVLLPPAQVPDPGTATTADHAIALAKAKQKAAAQNFNFNAAGAAGGAGTGTTLPPFDKGTVTSFLQQALGTSANPLIASLNAIIASAKAAGKSLTDSFIAQLKGENQRLIGLTKQRDQIAKQLQNAQQKLANLRQARAEIVSSVRSAVTGQFDITTAGQNDLGEPVTFFDIRSALVQAVRNAKTFTRVMKKLAKEGLPDQLLSQLAQAGPGALPQAQALLSATPKQLAGLKSQFRALTTQGKTLGRFIGNDLKGAGIQAAEGLIAGLKSKWSALTDAIRDLAKAMVAQLKRSLGISSPSKVMAQLGAFSGEGFAAGLASKYGAVVSEANRLANGALPRSQMQAWQQGGGGFGGDTHVTVNQHFPLAVPEPPSRSENAALRAARNALGAH